MIYDSNNILSELYEEVKYYRMLHHTILSIFIAGYTALVVLQVNMLSTVSKIPDDFKKQFWLLWVVFGILFIVIPLLITWLILHYHIVQGKILDDIVFLKKQMGIPSRFFRNDEKYEGFKDKSTLKQICIGFGQKIFVSLLLSLVITNILVFLFVISTIRA
jgi:hypothetical protein